MSKHRVNVVWERGEAPFVDKKYSRAHTWRFDGGAVVPGSAAAGVVPAVYCNPAAVDPEEALAAAVSSCHMLWFLVFAAAKGYVVDRYDDDAEALLAKAEDGKYAVTQIVLAPKVTIRGPLQPSPEEFDALHHQAHEECFIARSVKSEIVLRPVHLPIAGQ